MEGVEWSTIRFKAIFKPVSAFSWRGWTAIKVGSRKSKFGAFLCVSVFEGLKRSVNGGEGGGESDVGRILKIFKCEVMLKTEMWGRGKCMCGMERRRGTHPVIFLYLSGFPEILVSLM